MPEDSDQCSRERMGNIFFAPLASHPETSNQCSCSGRMYELLPGPGFGNLYQNMLLHFQKRLTA